MKISIITIVFIFVSIGFWAAFAGEYINTTLINVTETQCLYHKDKENSLCGLSSNKLYNYCDCKPKFYDGENVTCYVSKDTLHDEETLFLSKINAQCNTKDYGCGSVILLAVFGLLFTLGTISSTIILIQNKNRKTNENSKIIDLEEIETNPLFEDLQ
jgi:hypothetical protein